jgi:hypothetical protein
MLLQDASKRSDTRGQAGEGWLGRLLGWLFQAGEQHTEQSASSSAALNEQDQDLPAYRCPETDGPRLIAQVRPSASKRGDVYGWSRH